jgi:tetratricopeptide (TPR) repeat protein
MKGKWRANKQFHRAATGQRGAMRGRRAALIAILCMGGCAAQSASQISLREAIAKNNEATQLAAEGRDAEAEKLYLAALGAGYDDDLARAKVANNLGLLYQRQDRYLDAERMFRDALRWRLKYLPPTGLDVAYSLNNLAEIYRVEGRDWESRNLMETALRNIQQSNKEAPGYPIVLSNLAVVLCRFREFDDAEKLLRAALTSYEYRRQTDTREYGVTINNLAQVLESKNNFNAAASFYQQAIGIFERVGVPATTDLAAALANTGELYQRLARIEDARQAEERALELLRPDKDGALRAQVLRNLGNILAKAGQPADALPYFEQSLAIQEKTLGAEHLATAGLLLDYASATRRAGNNSLARKLRKRAMELLARRDSQLLDQMTVSVQGLRASK